MSNQSREEYKKEYSEASGLDVAESNVALMEPESEESVPSNDFASKSEENFPSKTVQSEPNVCRSYSPLIVCYHKPESGVAEQYRTLRTALLSRVEGERFCFAVTSSVSGEGKTLTCLNLGFVLSEYRHKKVVIVDCNLRKAGVSKFLGISSRAKGFAELVCCGSSVEEVVWSSRYSNLHIIPSGNVSGVGVPEIFGSARLQEVISELRREYDFVLLDVPSVTIYSDANVIGRLVGEVLFIVKMHSTSKQLVGQGIGLLKSLGVRVKGVVLTNHQRGNVGIAGRFF